MDAFIQAVDGWHDFYIMIGTAALDDGSRGTLRAARKIDPCELRGYMGS